MKLYFAFTLLTTLYFIPVVTGQKEKNAEIPELSQECNQIRDKLTKNMNILENVANTAQGIQQKDCNFAKSNVRLTKKYGNCLPLDAQDGMDTVYKNMRFVSRIICENVNKRILGCFGPENLKQYNQCTNKTIQYIDFMAKQKPKATTDLSGESKPQIRKKRFLLQNLFDGTQERQSGRQSGGIGGIPGLSILSDLTENFSSGLSGLISKRSKRNKSLTPLEQQCCMVHIQSDCFLSKVLNTCAEKSQLRMYKAFQTVFSFALRDVVDIACGRIETLDQCEKYSNNYDAEQDLGFRR